MINKFLTTGKNVRRNNICENELKVKLISI